MKVREVLKCYAKRLVSLLMTNTIKDAWKALKSALRDPIKLMQNRNDYHLELRIFPIDNAKEGLKAKVEWFLEL